MKLIYSMATFKSTTQNCCYKKDGLLISYVIPV
uniref:Uncharacterized protein n=1 Tax=Anguilla anguilla TaxID=7936 RepID=A0A0E9P986_ANGAN